MDGGDILGGDELGRVLAGAGPTLVLVESHDGLAGSLIGAIPDSLRPIRRAVGAAATRAKAGCVADLIDLDDVTGSAIVLENAQWIDPTSMGRVQRLMKKRDSSAVVIVAHTPVAPEDRWWLDQLAVAMGSNGEVIRTSVSEAPGQRSESPSNDRERDMVLASRMISDPISVLAAARFLDTSETEALAVAEDLARRGLLVEARSGFQAAPDALKVEAGEARLGHVAGRLAAALEETGEDEAVVGSLYMAAGNDEAAYPRLRNGAQAAQARAATGEAFHLATAALTAAESSSLGARPELGELHLICGRHLRAAGRSETAAGHLDLAVALLDGPARIDALGFAAAVADDRQRPQEAERILALAEWEAVAQEQPAKLGSLATFRARALNRIGFAAESDALLEKATAILTEHATPIQQFYASVNRAWILFDRGQMSQAEAEFTRLRDLTDSNDRAGLADKEAWRGRALFGIGQPRAAIEAVETARRLGSQAEVEAPLFLADLGLAEGSLLFGRPEDALAASDRVLDLVERQLPAWQNVARSNRALALLGLGRTEEAVAEIEAALAATPPGADGWRLRSRCRAIQMEVDAADGRAFPQREAEDLADMFLQSEFYGWAAELLCVVSEHTKNHDAAREALALANQVGNPMLAARAAEAGDLWRTPAAAPTIRAVRASSERLPDGWLEDWRKLPGIASALDAPDPVEDETGAENTEILQEALRRAGLVSAETILSPAQRRSHGLVRHRARRRSPLAVVAAALGVVVLAVATSLIVAQLTEPEPEPTRAVEGEATPTTVAAPLPLEETEIDVPVDLLFGIALDRGDAGRSGYIDVTGPRTVDGYYWIYEAADAIVATPLAYGNNLLVGSADGTYQAIDLTTGRQVWSLAAEDQIATSGSIGNASFGDEGSSGIVVVAGDDGIVRSRDAISVEEAELWNRRLGARVRSSPVVDGDNAYVATTAGFVYAVDLTTGNIQWTYPADDSEPLGPITAGLALDNGVIYVGTEDGELHLINTDGTQHCQSSLDGVIRVNPIVAEGRAYISVGSIVRVFPAGVCEVLISDTVQYLSESVVDVAPAVVGDIMYIPNGIFLNAIDRTGVEEGVSDPLDVHHWSPGQVQANGKIASPPVVTNDAVYFGTEAGWVYAVDSDTGELLWEWQTRNYVRASPVLVNGAVYIASGDGNIYAVGPAD